MSDARDTPPTSISRRESLRRAAGALALSLGAPAAFAATSDEDGEATYVLSFLKVESRRPVHTVRVSNEVGRMLMEPGAFNYLKLEGIAGESVTFEVRRRDRR